MNLPDRSAEQYYENKLPLQPQNYSTPIIAVKLTHTPVCTYLGTLESSAVEERLFGPVFYC
jgi:hypothetical protein